MSLSSTLVVVKIDQVGRFNERGRDQAVDSSLETVLGGRFELGRRHAEGRAPQKRRHARTLHVVGAGPASRALADAPTGLGRHGRRCEARATHPGANHQGREQHVPA